MIGSGGEVTAAIGYGRPIAARARKQTTFPDNGMLLALDGRCLDRLALPHTLQLCKCYGRRLDILLVNPPKPATLILGQRLQALEREGIDYRLSSGEGDLAVELPVYLHRFPTLSCVILDCLDKWETKLHPTLNDLRREGYRILTLLDRETDLAVSNAEWMDAK